MKDLENTLVRRFNEKR